LGILDLLSHFVGPLGLRALVGAIQQGMVQDLGEQLDNILWELRFRWHEMTRDGREAFVADRLDRVLTDTAGWSKAKFAVGLLDLGLLGVGAYKVANGLTHGSAKLRSAVELARVRRLTREAARRKAGAAPAPSSRTVAPVPKPRTPDTAPPPTPKGLRAPPDLGTPTVTVQPPRTPDVGGA
jgi:hypothetical protein